MAASCWKRQGAANAENPVRNQQRQSGHYREGRQGQSGTDVTKNVETALGTGNCQRKTGEYYEKATGPEVKLTR